MSDDEIMVIATRDADMAEHVQEGFHGRLTWLDAAKDKSIWARPGQIYVTRSASN